MKRILIALAMLAAVQLADAQVKSPEAAAKAIEKAEAATKDAKKAAKVATWTKLAEAYMDAYNAPAGNAWVGASKQELMLLMGSQKPQSEEAVTLNGAQYLKEVYEHADFYYDPATTQLVMIVVTKPVCEEPLAKALEAYKKAYEVDEKQSKLKDINAGISSINAKYNTDAFNAYSLGRVDEASRLFALAADASKTAPLNQIDTVSLYNAGFLSLMNKDYDSAKKYLEECLATGYYHEGGDVFAKLADIYTNLGDKEAAVKILEDGFTKFPQSQNILIGLINYYVQNKQDSNRLFDLIGLAKKNEPNNASLYYVEGNIYNELRAADPENADEYLAKAVAAYDACSSISPDYEFGYIGKGIMYYNIALDLQEKASNELDDAKYNVLNEQFTQTLKNAIEPFEKAYGISKDDALKVNIAEYLKNIYYRFYTEGPEYEAGYNKYNEVVKAGKPL